MFVEEDKRFHVSLGVSADRRYIFIRSESLTSTEVQVLDAYVLALILPRTIILSLILRSTTATARPFTLLPRAPGVEYWVDHSGEHFLIGTNADGATNFRLLEGRDTLVQWGSLSGFQERVPYEPEVHTLGITCFRQYLGAFVPRDEECDPRLVIWERRDGMGTFRVQSEETREVWTVALPETVHTVAQGPNKIYDTNYLQFTYESPLVRLDGATNSSLIAQTPPTTYSYNLAHKVLKVLHQEVVLGGYDKDEYCMERLYAPADDGTLVRLASLRPSYKIDPPFSSL